jgi:hypothetical protein
MPGNVTDALKNPVSKKYRCFHEAVCKRQWGQTLAHLSPLHVLACNLRMKWTTGDQDGEADSRRSAGPELECVCFTIRHRCSFFRSRIYIGDFDIAHGSCTHNTNSRIHFEKGSPDMEQTTPLTQIYCPHCYLATPEWRGRCIHCRAPLTAERANSDRQPAAALKKAA